MQDNNLYEPENESPPDPLTLFREWFAEASDKEPADPNAMCIATVSPEGKPEARMVLLKDMDERGFVFYTNMESRKGRALTAHPVAELCFYWKSIEKQIRIQGPVEQVSAAEADAYFASRPRGSRIGAWASKQSRPFEEPDAFPKRLAEYTEKYKDDADIPRPPYWSGYRVTPERIEFWSAGQYRLHTRLLYTRKGQIWDCQTLYP